jgi:hypothetical protein
MFLEVSYFETGVWWVEIYALFQVFLVVCLLKQLPAQISVYCCLSFFLGTIKVYASMAFSYSRR